MTHLPTVTIGICAYNESNTIVSVLRSILAQQQEGWKLKEILVLTDGCTDDTVVKAKRIQSRYLHILDYSVRRGKTYRLNQLFQKASGQILLMLDADIVIQDTRMVSKLIKEFANKRVGLVGGNSRPLQPQTFIQRAVYSTFEVFDASRKKHNSGHNLFAATGSCLAIRKEIAQRIRIPNIVNEDSYVYCLCKQLGVQFRYASDAVVYYTLPFTLTDYVKQVMRSEPHSVKAELASYFPDTIERETMRSFSWYAWEVVKSWVRNPFGVTTLIVVNLFCLPLLPYVIKHYNLKWFTASSTH